mgnify:FL=1
MNGALPIFPVGPGWIYQEDGSSASDSVSHRGEQSSRERAQHDDRERLAIQKQEGASRAPDIGRMIACRAFQTSALGEKHSTAKSRM